MSDSRILRITGRAVPVRGNDIDTDRIIPARFLRCVTFDGLGPHAFADDRAQATAQGQVHPFDDPRFQGAKILVVGSNFGCGSSREHAPQALAKWGIAAVVGVSFAEIFFGNCVAMGVPCAHVSAQDGDALQQLIETAPRTEVVVDLEAAQVRAGTLTLAARIPEGPRQQFLTGAWDAMAELREGAAAVRACADRLPYVRAFA